MASRSYDTILTFLKRNERSLATTLFITGFITDLLTFGLLDLPSVTFLFALYLVAVLITTVVAHRLHGSRGAITRPISILAPLFAQFMFGSLLSGFVIFYTKSAVFSVSWPFLILLLLIFFGNEVFRNYREHLIFQTLLVYFSLYAFFIFALPLYVHEIGTNIFLGSTGITLTVFGLYLFVLSLADRKRLMSALTVILISTILITGAVVGSYVAGLLPPIPLTLKSGGIYHSLTHEGAAYVVQGEKAPDWWDLRSPVVHHLKGTPLYAYSAIFAPGAFTTSVVHEWQRYNETTRSWNTKSTVAFGLSGGRAEGYRGYSLISDPDPGTWRVLVKTLNGQTIGKFNVTIVAADSAPVLIEQSL